MAITEAYAGSTAVSTTEISLTGSDTSLDTITTDGIYQPWLDLNALTKGDVFEFRVYEKVTSGATQRLVYSARFANAQSEPNWVGPSLILMHGWDMSLDKISGTDQTILWSIRAIT